MRPGTDTLRDAQDPDSGQWSPLTRITLERFNLIFSEAHSRGYASTGQPEHDAATALEDSFATLLKVVVGDASMLLSKWSVASGLEIDDVAIVSGADCSDTARPSLEVVDGEDVTVRVFYVGDDDNVHYIESTDGGSSFGAEQDVGALTNVKAIASVSTTKVHAVSYTSGNTRFHFFEDDGGWSRTDSTIYWPHQVSHIDSITIGDRDLVIFYSEGPMYGEYREAGIYGIWEEHGRWSDIFRVDVLDEADDYAYRKHPMISTANGFYFLTGYLSEGDEDYNHTTRFVKISKDGENWSQYIPLVTCPEAGPAKLLVIDAAADESWPWDTGQQVYIVGYDKIYESDATRLVGEENTALQVDVSNRTRNWTLQRGIISMGNTILSNHDGGLDSHSIINEDNTLLLIREAGYHTDEGDEYAQLTKEIVDFIKETDQLPQRHKQVASRDFMAQARDKEADHFEYWESQLVGYDNYADDTETGYGGLGHTATQKGWWETKNQVLWLRSNNEMGLEFATWDSKIMNGQIKAMFRVETSGNDEYAGLVFRAKDEGNFWACYYDEDSDKIILRQRVSDAWLPIAAQSSGTLGWSIDTYYGLMVDFRYSYIRVYRSTDGKTWTEDFTHIITPNALNPSPEHGYTGLLGYGYSSEDSEEDAGYTPPLPPPTPPSAGSGDLLYMVDFQSGHVLRTRNARAADPIAVVYEDLGFVGNNLTYIALDSWDPKNTAMVCGYDGVYKTTNLNDDTPAWTCVIDATGGDISNDYRAHSIASSICQQGLWMVSFNADKVYVFFTTTGGDSFGEWSSIAIETYNQFSPISRIEASSHNAQVAWVTYRAPSNYNKVAKTTDQWTSRTLYNLPWVLQSTPCNPHHRYLDNEDDEIAMWAVSDHTRLATDDTGMTGTDGTVGANAVWVQCSTWTANRWWLLAYRAANTDRFYVSDDGYTWTLQYTFSNNVRFISGWPYSEDSLYAAQDGTTAPLLISDDRGESWQAQTGNWADICTALGVSPDIYALVPVWTE
jgi:hypothetical protein